MDQPLFHQQSFKGINRNSPSKLVNAEYEQCRFTHCDFTETDLSCFKFIDCTFIECNLSLAKIKNTAFRDITFRDCKMLGLHFETCAEFGLSFTFENCTLQHASFVGIKIKKTIFRNSRLQEVDFTACDLSASVFDNCDLSRAVFMNTLLEKVDLHTAFGYAINPEINKVKKARFSLSGLPGLLGKYDIEIS